MADPGLIIGFGTVAVNQVVNDGTIAASLDGRPVDWTRPTTEWRAGDVVDDRYALAVPSARVGERYAIEATLYDEATLAPLVPLVPLAEGVVVAAPGTGAGP